MENKVSINNNSVDFSGITKDYMEAISELIWNGFDAGATNVNLIFDTNEIDFIPSIEIIDNGSGINLNHLHQTFGAFLDSLKRGAEHRSSYIRGKKGKGRFSFIAFAQTAIWDTTYFDETSGNYINYEVSIHAANKDFYHDDHQKMSTVMQTGTKLKLINLFGVTAYSFSAESFINYLKHEFGWFLLLNSKQQFKLCINGEPIEYDDILADHERSETEISDASASRFNFTITFVRWNEKIGDKFYYYFLNSDKKEVFKQLTSFNNNAINFYHSVYIESDYFNNFNFNDVEQSGDLFGSNPQSPIFRQLIKCLQKIVSLKQKAFVKENAAVELIYRFELSNSLPTFGLSEKEGQAKQQFIEVIKELYCIQPRIFKGLNDLQERLILSLIHLQLDNVGFLIPLIENLIPLNDEERQNLNRCFTQTQSIN
ncbi:ATP-binding protein [Pedobacter nototheniae]|uniref:ATP-binding protein n=1 Tax=Pedobacter nototheniae TaxID=2488994 RepID=UPI00293031C6|nr:ATP-binding protein [Pedobacter nototheniae]